MIDGMVYRGGPAEDGTVRWFDAPVDDPAPHRVSGFVYRFSGDTLRLDGRVVAEMLCTGRL